MAEQGPGFGRNGIRVGGSVTYLGVTRVIRDMRHLAGGDRLLFLEGGFTCRLPAGTSVPVPVGGWRTEPDTAPNAPAVTYEMRCAVCRRESGPYADPNEAQRWALAHLRHRPAHTAYREVIVRPWRAHPTSRTHP